ncbi:DHHA1 domain-containing protein, partial [Gluconobacter oxydans]|uniref:DHHA1 domain-containing protein n=1 Tax=Gluconobacter oxydans TaxID=442 RepID=UPI0039EB5C38
LKVPVAEAASRGAALLQERTPLPAQVAYLPRTLATGEGTSATESINGITLSARDLGDVSPKELKGLAESISKQIGSGVVALMSNADGRGSIVIAVTKDLTDRLDAVKLVREASALMGGKGGGGRPDMAQAGGPNADSDAVFAMLRKTLEAA